MDATNTQKRLNFYCQVMIVLLGLIAVRLWMMPVDLLPHAQAQIMDSGAQRLKIVKAAEKSNALLSEINRALQGTLTVKIEGESKDVKKNNKKRKKG